MHERREAELLSSLPVEHSKTYKALPGKPNRDRVAKMLALAKQYDLYKMMAVRQLDRWHEDQAAMAR